MILVGGWWGAGAGPGRLVRARRCGGAGRGAAAHRLTHWLWIFTVVSRAADRGSTPLQPGTLAPASSQFLPVQPAAVTSSSLITLSLCPRTPDRQHRWLTALQCCYLHQWGRGWSLVATVDTMVRPCVGGSDASSRPAPGACRWMVPCLSTLQHPPR